MRREFVHDIINKFFPTRKDLMIADIGCGGGALTKEMEVHGTCVGVDPSEQALEFCRTRGISELVLGSAEHTGLLGDKFDVVTCLDVLEHLENDNGAIDEIHRLLKVGGVGIIFVPAFMFLWGATDESSRHFRRYRMPELARKFDGAQFHILQKSYFNTLLFPLIALLRITVRLFSIHTKSEVGMGNSVTNEILYRIFSIERFLLRCTNLPFGVSAMLMQKIIP